MDPAADDPVRRRSIRALGLYYFSIFGGLGAVFPYFALWWRAGGLSPQEIAWIMMALPATQLWVPPLWGVWADAWGLRQAALVWSAFGTGVASIFFAGARGFWPVLTVMVAFCFFRSAATPLADAAAHALLGKARAGFGRIRVWGSVGFAASAAVGGWLGGSSKPERVVALSSALYLLAAWGARSIRADLTPPARSALRQSLRVLRTGLMRRLWAASAIYYGAHAAYDLFFALHLRDLGYDDAFVGEAWAFGVVVEVALMWVAPLFLGRTRAAPWLVLVAVAAAFRWWLVASYQTVPILLGAQALHALTFGLWYLAQAKWVQDRAPSALRGSVQGLLVTAMAAGKAIGQLGGAFVYDAGAGRAVFLAAAGLAGLSGLMYLAMVRAEGRETAVDAEG